MKADPYSVALELRNFEIQQLASRNNFFMIFQGVLFAGYMQSIGHGPSYLYLVVAATGFLVSLFQAGMAAGSKFWQQRWEAALLRLELDALEVLAKSANDQSVPSMFFLHSGKDLAEPDQKRYEKVKLVFDDSDELSKSDKYVRDLVYATLSKGIANAPTNWLIMRKYSVSRIPIYVGMILAASWFLILWGTFHVEGVQSFHIVFDKV